MRIELQFRLISIDGISVKDSAEVGRRFLARFTFIGNTLKKRDHLRRRPGIWRAAHWIIYCRFAYVQELHGTQKGLRGYWTTL
jgi:hypothetical protein